MTSGNGSTVVATRRQLLVPSPDPAPPVLSLKPTLVDRNAWNWVDRHGQDAAALSGLLNEFVEYLNARYAWTTEHTIPPCWALHGALIEEITTLMWSRWAAFQSDDAKPTDAQVWHTYYLPGFLTRVTTWLGGGHGATECRSGNHEPSRLPKFPHRSPPAQVINGSRRSGGTRLS